MSNKDAPAGELRLLWVMTFNETTIMSAEVMTTYCVIMSRTFVGYDS